MFTFSCDDEIELAMVFSPGSLVFAYIYYFAFSIYSYVLKFFLISNIFSGIYTGLRMAFSSSLLWLSTRAIFPTESFWPQVALLPFCCKVGCFRSLLDLSALIAPPLLLEMLIALLLRSGL
tara:strand:- start:268 stop:630 length:363 start_codon:yes stop_codon:yes gene_type:complete